MNARVYLVDANSWIDAFEKFTPPDVFPGLWTAIESQISSGRIRSIKEVVAELGTKSLREWIGVQSQLLQKKPGGVDAQIGAVFGKFPNLTRGRLKAADPWLVAYGCVLNCTVVTQEKRANMNAEPKLPDACDEFKVM